LPNSFCYNGANYSCPPNAVSGSGAQSYLDCSCRPGFMNMSTQSAEGMCQDCLADHYCFGAGHIEACVNDSYSPSQSRNSSSCTCNFGYMGVRNSPCVECVSPTYCYSGLGAFCPTGSISTNRSWSISNCTCNAGRYGMQGTRVYCLVTPGRREVGQIGKR
jgi:hypothetical protein